MFAFSVLRLFMWLPLLCLPPAPQPPPLLDHLTEKVILTNGQDLTGLTNNKVPIEHLSLTAIMTNNVVLRRPGAVIPQSHAYSRFHYQSIYRPYSHRLSYNQYCLLEEAVADIIRSYLRDTSSRQFVVDVPSRSMLFDESILSYFPEDERQRMTRFEVIDLDHDDDSEGTKRVSEHKWFVWNVRNHPRM